LNPSTPIELCSNPFIIVFTMHLISSTLLTVAFFTLFVAASPTKTESPPHVTTPTTTPTTTHVTTPTAAANGKKPTTSDKKPPVVSPKGPVQEGKGCFTESSTEGEVCAKDLICSSNSLIKFRSPGYCVKKKAGEYKIGGLETGDFCVNKGCKAGLICKSDPSNLPETTGLFANVPKRKCGSASKAGERCSDHNDCVQDTYCHSGKCAQKLDMSTFKHDRRPDTNKLKLDIGAACYSTSACKPELCCVQLDFEAGTCGPRKIAGEECMPMGDMCATGLACRKQSDKSQASKYKCEPRV
jgi:hypothetical protein